MSGAPLSRHPVHRSAAVSGSADLARELDRAGLRLWQRLSALLWAVFVGGGLLTLALGIGASVVYGRAVRLYSLAPLNRVGVNFGLLALLALALTVAALFVTGWTRELALRQWAWAAPRVGGGRRGDAPVLLPDPARLERLRQTLCGWLLAAQLALPLWWLLAALLPPLLWAAAAAHTPLPPLGRAALPLALMLALTGLLALWPGLRALSGVGRWLTLSVAHLRGLHTPGLGESAAQLRCQGPALLALLLLETAATLWAALLLGDLLWRLGLPGQPSVLLFALLLLGVVGLLLAVLRAALDLAGLLALAAESLAAES